MKIIRNNQEFELTERELMDAYYVQQHIWDIADLNYAIDDYIESEEDYTDIVKQIRENKEMLSAMAYRMRKMIDNWDYEPSEAARAVIGLAIEGEFGGIE